MTTPLHGVGHQFESGRAHLLARKARKLAFQVCASDLVAMIGPCQELLKKNLGKNGAFRSKRKGSHPRILGNAKIGSSNSD